MANLNKTKLSQQQLLQRTFEENSDRLRVSIGDETDSLAINSNGSINTILQDLNGVPYSTLNPLPVNVTLEAGGIITSTYNEVTGISAGITTLLCTYTAAIDIYFQKVETSGTNVAEYRVLVDGTPIDKKRSYFGGDLNVVFEFNQGLILPIGSVVEVYVLHNRPTTGDFNARIQTRAI